MEAYMKILNFGSLNIDHTYRLPRRILPGETLSAAVYLKGCGGKGLNQSVALARAGAPVFHAGLVGEGGDFLRKRLAESGVDCRYLKNTDLPNGHAIIQVDPSGENSIVLYPGSNHALTPDFVDQVLANFGPGDLLLLQNETNMVPYLIRAGRARGMDVAFNAAPMEAAVKGYPLELLRFLLINETEGAALTGCTEPEAIADAVCSAYPELELVLTLGAEGAIYRKGGFSHLQPARQVRPLDTTGAGDAFIGYFLAGIAENADPLYCLYLATAASAIAVTRPGASDSIPAAAEVKRTL